MGTVLLLSATTYTLFGLASVFTIGRVLSRWRRLRGEGYGWDDLASVFAFACAVGLVVADYYQLANGLGRESYLLDGQNIEKFLLWRYISQHFYIAVIFCAKLSLVLLYIRIWPGRSVSRTLCWILASALTCAFVAFEVVAILQCLPVTYNWRLVTRVVAATCIDKRAYAYSLASVDIAFNVAVLVLPVPRLVKVETTLARKIGILAAFLVGLAVIAISSIRIEYLDVPLRQTNLGWGSSSYITLYNSIEAFLLQICCCIPALTMALTRNPQHSSRLSDSSRNFASTSRSGEHSSSRRAVIGMKGIGPSDPEKAHFGDYNPEDGEEYERAPSPTIALQSDRMWEETIASISQQQITPQRAGTQFTPPFPIDAREEEEEEEEIYLDSSTEEDVRESDGESGESPRGDLKTMGMPSIIGKKEGQRDSEPRPQSVRLSTDLVPSVKEVRVRPSRLDLHSW